RGTGAGAAASVSRPDVGGVPGTLPTTAHRRSGGDHMYDTQSVPRSASAQVVAHVKEAIRSGRLSPGQRLLESELTGRLGMSRGPVREALAQLQVEGFID